MRRNVSAYVDQLSTLCQDPVNSHLMSGKRRPTIRDVAAAAGVSVTTVSDALSGKGRLPEKTRQKVRSASEALNFRQSAIALGLREKGLGLVGLCIAPAGESLITDVAYWATVVTHASQTALAEGWALVLLPNDVKMLAQLKVPIDGVIVGDPLENDPILTFLEERRIRFFSIGRDLARQNEFWLDDDNASGVSQLLEKTIKPKTSVAYVTMGPKKSYVVDGLTGAQSWSRANGSPLYPFHCLDGDDDSVKKVVAKCVEAGVGAIVAQHYRLAIRILTTLKAFKVKIPEDIRVLSGSDSQDLDHMLPPISSVRQHPRQLAEMATRALINQIRGKSDAKFPLLPIDTVIRS